jgi:ABC-2 type transport system ATP-binding protein
LDLQAGLFGVPKRERRTLDILATVGLADKAEAYARTLSGGMKRRLMVAKAMVHNPPVLVLDEPTAGVDVELRQQLWGYVRALNRQGVTVLLTTHYLEEAEDCEQVAFLAAGKIIGSGAPQTLVQSLGSYIIEVEGEPLEPVVASLSARLGPCLQDGAKASFRIHDEQFNFLGLQAEIDERVRSVRWRRPNLNDVFLWVNDPTLSAGLTI